MVLIVGLAIAPNTGHAQQGSQIRGIDLLSGPSAIDMYLNDVVPATISVQYGFTSKLVDLDPDPSLNIKVTPTGTGIGNPLITYDLTKESLTEYLGLAYGTQANPKFKILSRPRVSQPPANKAFLRVMHAAATTTSFDIYLDSLNGPPLFSSLTQDSVTPFSVVGEDLRLDPPATLFITQAGKKLPLATLVLPLKPYSEGLLSRVTLFITGTGTQDMKVYAFHGERDEEEYQLAVLEESGNRLLPSVRAVHAWPTKNVISLDVYLDNTLRTPRVYYRGTSEVYQALVEDSVTVAFAPVGEGVGGSVMTRRFDINSDTGYTVILTQHNDGGVTSMIVPSYLQEPNVGVLKIRFANATDFFGPISLLLRAENGDTMHIDNVAFLTNTDWREFAAGNIKLEAYQQGADTAFYKGDYTAGSNKLLTLIALGTPGEGQFSVDVLDETVSSLIAHMPSFSGPVQSVAAEREAAASALRVAASPNPFSTSSRLNFTLASGNDVHIALFDALGRRVLEMPATWLEVGTHTVELRGENLAPGVYTCIVQAGDTQAAYRIMVVR